MFKVNNKTLNIFPTLNLNIFHTFPNVFAVDFEQVNVRWEGFQFVCVL